MNRKEKELSRRCDRKQCMIVDKVSSSRLTNPDYAKLTVDAY